MGIDLGIIEQSEESKTFIYALNKNGTNKYWFNVSGGDNDDKSKVSIQDIDAIGDEVYRRLTMHDELVSELRSWVSQYGCTLANPSCSKCQDTQQALKLLEGES